MAQDNIAEIVGRAVIDEEFRKLLFSNPQEALKDYTLTDDETDALMKIKEEDLVDFGGKLDKRITKSKIW